ncbi:hypothetical protein CN107_34490, partial [Sinorhizobium meliloti]
MQTALTPPPLILLPISGSSVGFPVRRVYCVGRNYAAHAREMGHDPAHRKPDGTAGDRQQDERR